MTVNILRRPVLDLDYRHKTHIHGDITVIETWFGEDPTQSQPCLAIVPSYRRMKFTTDNGTVLFGAKPYVVLLHGDGDTAVPGCHSWDDPKYAARKVFDVIHALAMEPSMALASRVIEIIHQHLQELYTMPETRPVEQAIAVAEATVTDGWGRARSTEIIEHV